MVVGRVGTNDNNYLSVCNVLHLIRHRTRTDSLKQRGDRRRMTQASTVVDIIGTESGTYQLLEKIGLFIATFCRPEPRQRRRPLLLKHPLQTINCKVERFVPRGLSKHAQWLGRIKVIVQALGHSVAANQRCSNALRVIHVIEPITAFNTKPSMVRGAIASSNVTNAIIFYVVGEQATHTTVWAYRVNLTIYLLESHPPRWHQRSRWASLHTFTTTNAGTLTHGVTQIEHDLRMGTSMSKTDHIVGLYLAARPQTTSTLDTRF